MGRAMTAAELAAEVCRRAAKPLEPIEPEQFWRWVHREAFGTAMRCPSCGADMAGRRCMFCEEGE